MNKRHLKAIFALLLFSPTCSQGQGVPPSAPKDPFVVSTPEYAAWEVTYKSKPPKKGGGENTQPLPEAQSQICELKKLNVVKAGNTRQLISTWSDGTTTERWIIPGYQLFEEPGQDGIYIYTDSGLSHSNFSVENYAQSDFPEMAWLTDKNFLQFEIYEKKACWTFTEISTSSKESKLKPMMLSLQSLMKDQKEGKADDPPPEIRKTAWIDTDSKLPVAFYDGTKLAIYSFGIPPTQAPTMPERFAKIIRDYEKEQADLEKRYRMKP